MIGQQAKDEKTLFYKLIDTCRKASNSWLLLYDVLGIDNNIAEDDKHLEGVMLWLYRTQDTANVCGDVSKGYFPFNKGRLTTNPIYTGSVVPTFLQYALLSNDYNFTDKATEIGKREIYSTLSDGTIFSEIDINKLPNVFRAGQLILSWVALYKKTMQSLFLEAAIKVADWLVSIQDDEGSWSKYVYNGVPHAYHSCVSWALLEIFELKRKKKYKSAAEKNILWVLNQANENGWFPCQGFSPTGVSPTNIIGYTLRGLLECAFFLDELQIKITTVVQKALENIMMSYERRKKALYLPPLPLPAMLDKKWRPKAKYSCISGNSQISIVWMKQYLISGDARFLNASIKILDQVKTTQFLHSKDFNICGAIPESYPRRAGYYPLFFSTLAAKNFADALMLQIDIMQKIEGEWK